MENKKCKICNISQPLSEYYNKKEKKDGKHIYCKTCMKKEKKIYYKDNPRKGYFKSYREKNKEYFNNYCNQHYHSNKDLYREWNQNKYETDLGFRLKHVVAARINQALKLYNELKKDRTIEYLGCSIGEYIEYIEQKLSKDMNWENYGEYWEIDHIKPIASYDLSNEEEMYSCFHFQNTQPLLKEENREKSDKY